MQVAILGAGAVAFASAALLAQGGHDPVLWSPSGRRTAALAGGARLVARNAVEGEFHPRIAASCVEALAAADVVYVAVPGYAHRAVIDAMAPLLRPDQPVVFSSHMSFSLLYLLQRRAVFGPAPMLVAWGTTVVTGRQTSLSEVFVSHVRAKVDMAVLPASAAGDGLALCIALFGDRFVLRDSLTAIGLSNLNPQNHLAIALCNLTRMEKGETWLQYANITGAVGRLMEALDAERLAIAAAYGVQVRTLQEHFRLSFAATGETMAEMAASLSARGADVAAPATLDSRYVTEDVPFGLWPTVCLAEAAGRKAPLHEAGVRMLSALYGRDFAAENDLLPALGDLAAALARADWLTRNA
jgi:opine dehydrogenase